MCSVKNRCDVERLATEAELSSVFQKMEVKTDHHVRFEGAALIKPKDNNVIIQSHGNGSFSLHLGFLQVGHRYHITFLLTPEMCPNGPPKEPPSDEGTSWMSFNPNCRLLSINPHEGGTWQLVVEYFAHKEKLLKEDLVLPPSIGNDSTNFKLTFHARVLGQGKGTPLLRNGIHCVGVELEDEAESSDWQGFD